MTGMGVLPLFFRSKEISKISILSPRAMTLLYSESLIEGILIVGLPNVCIFTDRPEGVVNSWLGVIMTPLPPPLQPVSRVPEAAARTATALQAGRCFLHHSRRREDLQDFFVGKMACLRRKTTEFKAGHPCICIPKRAKCRPESKKLGAVAQSGKTTFV